MGIAVKPLIPIDMVGHHINKDIKNFGIKNISENKNVFYNITVIILVLLAASQQSSINERANSPNADTIFYRINGTTIRSMQDSFWQTNRAFLRQYKKKLSKCKCFISVDETYDSYSGNLHKKPITTLTKKQRIIREYIHKYRVKRGDTGSFKYLVFALTYGKKRRVLYVKPIKRKESYWKFTAKMLKKIQKELDFECALLDRGFYNSEIVNELNKHNIPFIIRARLDDTKKKIYGIFAKWRKYDYNIAKKANTNLILGLDGKSRRWAFITNIKDWKKCKSYYKKRWDIENIFKATDGIQIRCATSNHKTRMFCVCLSFLIYNAWQKKNKKPTLKIFLKKIVDFLIKKVLKISKYFNRLSLEINAWDLIIKGFK